MLIARLNVKSVINKLVHLHNYQNNIIDINR